MKVRFLVFFLMFSIVFPLYAATTNQQGSGSGKLGKPSVKFKEWEIGRSNRGTDARNKLHLTFITSTGTSCRFKAVGRYDGNQGDNVSPIDPKTVSWEILDHEKQGLKKESLSFNWSGSHPSKFSVATSFNAVGNVSVPAYKPTAKPDICKDENNHLLYLSSTRTTDSSSEHAKMGMSVRRAKKDFIASSGVGLTLPPPAATRLKERVVASISAFW